MQQNDEFLRRYQRELYGDELPEQSAFVSNDCFDIVEADMPPLVKMFLGSGDVMRFSPRNTEDDEDVREADEKTKYVDWQIRKQPWSYRVLSGWMKNAEILKTAVVKYYIDETTEIEEHKKTGLSDQEVQIFQESLEGEDVKSVEIVREEVEAEDSAESTVVWKVEKTRKMVKVKLVNLESFRMTKNAEDKNDADLVGDVQIMKRGDLLAMGFKRELISQIPLAGGQESKNSDQKNIRDLDEGLGNDGNVTSIWAQEEVEIEDLYPMIDYDDDGIPERRHIMRGGDVILENEVFNHVPYAMFSAVNLPNKAIGMSRVEVTAPTAEAKTYIQRGIHNNIYAVNNPRLGVNKNVNMDDLFTMRINGVVRSTADSPVGNDITSIQVPYIGDKALQIMQFLDTARAQSTGSQLASQGLEADDFAKETATRFEGVKDASQEKIHLVARNYADGWRELYEGVAWLDEQFQDTTTEITVLGKQLSVDPRKWKTRHEPMPLVGLAAGDDDEVLKNMTAVWSIQNQLKQEGSPLVDEVKRYNTLSKMLKAIGQEDVSQFANDPNEKDELLKAQNEILNNLVLQLQEQLQATQNPLAEAENIKAQAKLVEAQGKRKLDIAQMLEDQRQFRVETAQKQDQFHKELTAKLTELELKYNADVPGSAV
jgi:hypothetical protein